MINSHDQPPNTSSATKTDPIVDLDWLEIPQNLYKQLIIQDVPFPEEDIKTQTKEGDIKREVNVLEETPQKHEDEEKSKSANAKKPKRCFNQKFGEIKYIKAQLHDGKTWKYFW